MEDLTFEQLPTAVSQLFNKLEAIEALLQQQTNTEPNTPEDELLTVPQAAKFLNLTVATIYSKVSRQELPVMKRGKRLYFSKKELVAYLQAGRKKTLNEIAAEANTYLSNHQKKAR